MQSRNMYSKGDEKLRYNYNSKALNLIIDNEVILQTCLANEDLYLEQGYIKNKRNINEESILFGISQSNINLPCIKQIEYNAYKPKEINKPQIHCPDLTIYNRFRPT